MSGEWQRVLKATEDLKDIQRRLKKVQKTPNEEGANKHKLRQIERNVQKRRAALHSQELGLIYKLNNIWKRTDGFFPDSVSRKNGGRSTRQSSSKLNFGLVEEATE